MSFIRITTPTGQTRLTTAAAPRNQTEPFSLKQSVKASISANQDSSHKGTTFASPAPAGQSIDAVPSTLSNLMFALPTTQQFVATTITDKNDNTVKLAPCAEAQACTEKEVLEEDLALIDGLAKLTDSGIFELLLPQGECLGVVLERHAGGFSFLLGTSDKLLNRRLQNQKMELEGALKQRMGEMVRLTVLPATVMT